MKPKTVLRLCADVGMTVSLLFLSGYQFWGEAAHEWIGVAMLVLFLLHHMLNLNWHRRIFRGKYTTVRTVNLCVDLLILLAMLTLFYSGIVISRHVFVFLPIEGGMALARRLHLLASYWGFVLMSVHLGLHWSMVLGFVRRSGRSNRSKAEEITLFLVSASVAVNGIFAFVRRNLATYLFLRSEFVFFDYGEPRLFFYADYISVMGLFIFVAHYGAKLCRRRKERKK